MPQGPERTPARPRRRRARLRALSAATFAVALVPLLKIVWDGVHGGLGANPIEAVLNRLGFWTLTFLALSLVPSPAHDLLGFTWPVRIRRMLGLFAFSYATLHLLFYVGVDQALDVRLLAQDVAKRKFMTVGFAAWLLLTPLAVTSTDAWVRRLGYRRWKQLHRTVYGAALLAIVHFAWRVKADLRRPAIAAALVLALLGVRLAQAIRSSLAAARSARLRARSSNAERPGADTHTA